MTPELKNQWVDALRSGMYTQATGRLHNGDNKRCCLGVLADVVMKTTKYWRWEDARLVCDAHRYTSVSTGFLPTKFLREVELGVHTMGNLGDMNDGRGNYDGQGKSFKEIADWIEKNI